MVALLALLSIIGLLVITGWEISRGIDKDFKGE
jgi:hypothetical protein